MFWLWWSRGRDPRGQPIAVQYDPPDGLSPGEVGALVDSKADMRDITATIVDLAVRGYIQIEQTEESAALGLIHHRDYIFHLRKPAAEWKDAEPHELLILSALFDNGARDATSLADMQNHFYKNLPGIRDSLFAALMARDYFLHRPDTVRATYIGAGIVSGVLIAFGGVALSAATGMVPTAAIVAGFASTAIICGFGWLMPAHTIAGKRALEKVLGFEDFLSRVEAPQMEKIVKTPEMFEKFLPFAMALGVEKKWAGAFADIYRQPPDWYRGAYGNNFMPIFFVNDLNLMSHQAGAAMASAPRSSSGSSGFGGGGFSGGGFGGGGGGGF